MKAGKGYALPKKNLLLLAVGFVIILFGFILMIGGGSEGTEFNPEIFSAQRVTVGPMIALFGFVFEIFAILWVRDEDNSSSTGLTLRDEDNSVSVSE
ncbi:MAG: DUF3098 domain-containing protein [Bacteroidales bacterium]|jgi:amino acid permease|nr:DUF3098 domain-containing protein [Bacteroidales bacterium]MBP5704553.1 DUF3098 domain-containing protein [Paludibacteraceae bacterium]MBR5210715.1 DUF3098 domain-containing protein [Paludibacteraceae bacterium]MBR6596442.1 DUF3098 domain-containing protein [Paludibacteraceae bacterium]MEE1082925.1 DUF3098 domain-containing protein [Paludibacteraceae bacterium]